MAVAGLVDAPAVLLREGLDAVRDIPPPLGQVPARLGVLARAAQELHGVYLLALHDAETAGEHTSAGRSTADLLVDTAGLPVTQARRDVALARRLGRVPGLLEALAGGGTELAAARLVARAFDALPPRLRDRETAQALITLAGLVDLADLKAKVDELVSALAPDVTDGDLADARETGELVLTDVGAQTRFDGHTDALQGEWLREVLAAKAEADRGLADGRSSGQRLLDALLDCVRVAVQAGTVPLRDDAPPLLVITTTPADLLASSDPDAAVVAPEDALVSLFDGTDLLAGATGVTASGGRADTDPRDSACSTAPRSDGRPTADHTCAAGWTTRSRGGVRLGPRSLATLSCHADITRLLLDPRGWPIGSTPTARQIGRRERRALEHRAGYRCERLGCGRPAAACVPHHVVPFALGGPSTLANCVLLCRSCHHLLHDRDRPLELTGDRRIGPRGWLRGNGPP